MEVIMGGSGLQFVLFWAVIAALPIGWAGHAMFGRYSSQGRIAFIVAALVGGCLGAYLGLDFAVDGQGGGVWRQVLGASIVGDVLCSGVAFGCLVFATKRNTA
jgi:uncharacterized membrane protein YeaQ/YmgE (transglycosylase-associated protein family)